MAKIKVPRAKKLPTLEKQNFLNDNFYIIMSFVVPFLLMTVAFAVHNVAPFGIFKTMYDAVAYHIGNLFPSLGITLTPNMATPWGDSQMLVVDLWHQYYPFLYDLHEKLQEGGSLFWTWSVGMGSNFIAMMSYYLLSPLNFLSVVIPDSWLVEYLALATVIKISCAGMFTAICFKILFKRNDLSLLIFSVMFALCSFNMGYYWCVIWLDSVAMLPLVVAGTVSLLRDGKFKLFTISLALAVVFNYYIGLFICVAVFFTAVGYTVSRWHSMRKALKDLLRTVVCSVIALLMTAPVTIPAYLALQNCYKSTSGMPTKFDINIGTDDADGVFDAIIKIFSNFLSFLEPTSKEGLPNVACGLLCILLAVVFLCSKKIKLSEKLFCSGTILFLIASFIFRHLDYMWHGFHYPNMLPYRFSFLVSFLLIYMAFRAFTLLEHSSFIDLIIALLVFVLILLPSVFTVFKVFAEPLLDEEHVTQGAVYGSIAVAVVMLALLLLFTMKVLPRRIMAAILCLVVLGEMTATAIIGVDTVSTTTMSGYPKESDNVARIVSHIDKWAESDPDIARTEVTGTQTLNDGALNSFNGISVFNSMANVNITKYTEHMGCTGWKAGNRYTYYESSPVTNVILNLKYLIARDGVIHDTMYMEEIDSSGVVKLYENQAYIPMGYMTNSSLQYLTVDESVTNPFENQNEFWRLATGIEEPVYKQLTVVDQGHTSSDKLSVTKSDEGIYYASAQDSTADLHTKFNYYLEEDALVLAYYYVGGADSTGDIYINDQVQSSKNVKQPFISCVGEYKAGDKISLYCNLKTGTNCNIRAFCYTLNEEVFEQGLEILRQSVLDATKATDTCLEGTINVGKSGLLYTSIPYEKGWSVYVDGKKAEMIPVGNGACAVSLSAGQHTVKFSYVPDGFLVGMAAFTFAFLLFAAMCLLTSKKMRDKDNALVKCAVWFFDPKVKDKPKPEPEELAEGEEAPEGEAVSEDGEISDAEETPTTDMGSDSAEEVSQEVIPTEDEQTEETSDTE